MPWLNTQNAEQMFLKIKVEKMCILFSFNIGVLFARRPEKWSVCYLVLTGKLQRHSNSIKRVPFKKKKKVLNFQISFTTCFLLSLISVGYFEYPQCKIFCLYSFMNSIFGVHFSKQCVLAFNKTGSFIFRFEQCALNMESWPSYTCLL